MMLIGMGSPSLNICRMPADALRPGKNIPICVSLYVDRYKDTPPMNSESLQPTKKRHAWALKTIYEPINIYIYVYTCDVHIYI